MRKVIVFLFFVSLIGCNSQGTNKQESSKDALSNLHQAVYDGDFATVQKYLSAGTLSQLKKSGFDEGKKLLSAVEVFLPEEIIIGEVNTEEIKAVVSVTAKIKSNRPLKYVSKGGKMVPEYTLEKIGSVEMVKESDSWKFKGVTWVNKR
ncbi:MAG: hypothetical protein GY858_01585 [Candidatus Omnitrophica bacterium]|nr:hypothetical protein [Candidatus Omnitrophota bacterium]